MMKTNRLAIAMALVLSRLENADAVWREALQSRDIREPVERSCSSNKTLLSGALGYNERDFCSTIADLKTKQNFTGSRGYNKAFESSKKQVATVLNACDADNLIAALPDKGVGSAAWRGVRCCLAWAGIRCDDLGGRARNCPPVQHELLVRVLGVAQRINAIAVMTTGKPAIDNVAGEPNPVSSMVHSMWNCGDKLRDTIHKTEKALTDAAFQLRTLLIAAEKSRSVHAPETLESEGDRPRMNLETIAQGVGWHPYELIPHLLKIADEKDLVFSKDPAANLRVVTEMVRDEVAENPRLRLETSLHRIVHY